MKTGLLCAVTILLLTVLTGCLGPDADPEVPPVAAPTPLEVDAYAAERLIQSHDHHSAHAEHAGSIGFENGTFLPLRTPYVTGETFSEAAVKGGYAYVTFGPGGGNVALEAAGFHIVDVSDPLAPSLVGTWLGQPLGDLEVSNDGNTVFASTQRNLYPYPWTVNPDAGPLGHLMRGTFLVDVSDKSAPTTVGFAPLPTNGPHTITYFEAADGRELLLQSTYDILFTAYPENLGQNVATQRVVISEVVTTPAGVPTLQPLSTFQILVEPEEEASRFPHDATAFVHPETGQTLMTVAYWNLGMIIVDISDPAAPEEVSRFDDTSPSAYVNTHLVRVFPGLIDGRVIAVMEPEIPNGQDAGQYTFVDITDPAAPTKLGHWTIPGELVIDEPFLFSPHNFDLLCAGTGQPLAGAEAYTRECVDPTVVLSHFHGGLWVLNARDPANATSRAFHFPLVERRDVPEGGFTGFLTAFGVDGFVYAPELHSGLHVLPLPLAAPDA